METQKIPTKVFINLTEDKKRRILDAAVREFSKHGFHRASINRLVKNLGIAKGSIFQYFGSKEGLFKVTFEYCIEQVKKSLRKIKHQSNGVSFFDKIKNTVFAGIEFAKSHPEAYQLYLKMVFQEDFPFREMYIKQIHIFSADYLRDLVVEGIERGELKKDLNIDATVFFLDSLLDRFVQAYVVEFLDAGAEIHAASNKKISSYVDELINLLKTGLGAGER